MTCFAVCAAMRPKLLGRHVLAVDQLVRDLRPVDLEIVVGEQRVVLLAGLLLDALEVVEGLLACLVEQSRLEVLGDSIENTRKSPLSSSSTVACRDAPGVFL